MAKRKSDNCPAGAEIMSFFVWYPCFFLFGNLGLGQSSPPLILPGLPAHPPPRNPSPHLWEVGHWFVGPAASHQWRGSSPRRTPLPRVPPSGTWRHCWRRSSAPPAVAAGVPQDPSDTIYKDRLCAGHSYHVFSYFFVGRGQIATWDCTMRF